MKFLKTLVAGITVFCLVCASSVSVSANTSTLTVTTSNGSAFTSYSDYSTVVGASHSAGYATLVEFRFANMAKNEMPLDDTDNYCRINARLYTRSASTMVSEVAHYNGASLTKSLPYLSGYGSVGAQYRLKTNSNSSKTYYAIFTWGA